MSEPSAAIAPFQCHQPTFPPRINVNSADHSLTSASHFSGQIAKSAQIANLANQANS
jgi:hypothetical protein